MTKTDQSNLFRLYIDESGDHVYHDLDAMREPGHRYLALVGCFFKQEHYIPFQRSLEDMKLNIFQQNPDDPVILHRKEIINRRGPFWRLRDPEVHRSFNNQLLSLLSETELLVIGVVIDKLKLYTLYDAPWHPYHIALNYLLRRYCGFLNHRNRLGDVMAESRGKFEDQLLQNAYNHIYLHGDMYNRAKFYQQVLTSKKLKLRKKEANIAGLQLADLIAYNAKKDILIEEGMITSELTKFEKQLQDILNRKYNKHFSSGKISGYGKVLFPK